MIFPVEMTAAEFAQLQQQKVVTLDRSRRPLSVHSLVLCYVQGDDDMTAHARVQDSERLTLRLS